MESDVIIEEWSPFGNIEAIVEKTDRTYFFYLWINPETQNPQMRSCWICNRVKAPASIDEAFAAEDQEPCMPAEFVAHDINGIDIDESNLSIQWFEEGDAAALLSGDKIIAVIPGFSGYNDFYGYSIYAKGMGPFAWDLKQAYSHMEEGVKNSKKFWDYFETDFWGEVQHMHMDLLQKFFGDYDKYYAIDKNEFPPKALVTGKKDGKLYAFTLGVSMFPMPGVEMSYGDDYKDYRRIELGFSCNEAEQELFNAVLPSLSFMASFPWNALTFLGHGHTVPFNKVDGYEKLLLLNSREINDKDHPDYGEFMGEKINLLWAKPITKEEFDVVAKDGVDAYLKKWIKLQ